ncbi:NAD(P)/FAD-dependent oxidoreductase [Denitrobaculum tricleocarpae]|uniref:NAD(P)/FAD-dependent oxidoreductase n=1 Tax=Denitrobaculum tricleocarpae TaxID=2591009 RepID=A0A545TY64_9PROT|nr:NAD(P)/FAD-dependent oxidoreductase [Denitrobaculum tricleocarpae]TQV82131.1 NAD(P)/FAD-dependent oxidoreductase [Denitrobaculum tricleocarpae]
MTSYDVIILGAGAAGLMAAIEAGKRGRSVLLLDHAKAAGEKIRISGGGRCNFTNLHTAPANFLSQNPRFCVSALKRYTQRDFIGLVESHGIAYHEKTLGQLFCDGSSKQIVGLLLEECSRAGVELRVRTRVGRVERLDDGFSVAVERDEARDKFICHSLVIATGGPSIPKMGATGFGYDLARKFGMKVVEPSAALVPLTFDETTLRKLKHLAGVSLDAVVSCGKTSFAEALLFTHRGLSGPAILQISSYWHPGREISVDLLPQRDAFAILKQARSERPKQELKSILSELLPRRLALHIVESLEEEETPGAFGRMADLSDKKLRRVAVAVKDWRIMPQGTEGFRTAEVTLGGVDTNELSSKTFEAKKVPGLYFIGEVIDVTGHLGGFNFQWAWASGFAAGQYV